MKKNAAAYAAGIFLLAGLLLAPWRGNFPLNDDWIYALPVKNLFEHNGLRLFDMFKTQLVQTGWGWLWVKLFGFSFGVLRLSTLAAGAASVWVFGKLLLKLEVEPRAAFLGAFCLAFNPLFFALSQTFMTEVPYLFLTLLSVHLFADRRAAAAARLWPVSLCALGATLIRPTGLLLPAGFSLRLLTGEGLSWRKAAALWLPALAALAGWALWMNSGDAARLPGAAAGIHGEAAAYWLHPAAFIAGTLSRLGGGLLLYGLFLLPFSAAIAAGPGFLAGLGRDRRACYALAAVLIFCCAHIFLAGWAPLPGLGNYVYRTGLGYVTIYGYAGKACGLLGFEVFWPAVTVLSALSAGVLAARLSGLKDLSGPAKDCLVIFLLQFAFLLAAPRFFDRYFVYLLPLGVAAACLAARPLSFSFPALLAAAGLALFSWAGTADYLAWNGAKWALAGASARYGIAPETVAGGVDYDAWNNYERRMAQLRAARPGQAVGEWDWLDLASKKAMVAFAPPPGLEGLVLERARYFTPLAPFSGGTLCLFRLPQAGPAAAPPPRKIVKYPL